MLNTIWYNFLYQPLFNGLIWIYVNIAHQNLGWAVVWLTILLRIVLLPLSILSLRNNDKHTQATLETSKTMEAHKNDRVAQKESVRKIMKKYKISPWAKIVVLGIQLLVIVLLYQVFLQGISGDKVIKTLYPVIDYPGKINVMFYGFDIGHRNDMFWAGITAFYLFLSTVVEIKMEESVDRSDVYFIILFPLATLTILWYLPMVKSLFILTTLLFSDMLKLIAWLAAPSKKKVDAHGAAPVHH
jgi:hypothetical protein